MTRQTDDDPCGFSYDHDLDLIDERDGEAVYECRSCGAEVVTGPETDTDPSPRVAGEKE